MRLDKTNDTGDTEGNHSDELPGDLGEMKY